MLQIARAMGRIYGYSDSNGYWMTRGRNKRTEREYETNFDYDNDKELELIAQEMQKTVLGESESLIRKILCGLLKRVVFI